MNRMPGLIDSAWRSLRFLACWAGLYVTFFTLAGTKLPSYVLPCYPALAVMTGKLVVLEEAHLFVPERAEVRLQWIGGSVNWTAVPFGTGCPFSVAVAVSTTDESTSGSVFEATSVSVASPSTGANDAT